MVIVSANLNELINGVRRFGGTGEHHRHFSDETEKFFVDFLAEPLGALVAKGDLVGNA